MEEEEKGEIAEKRESEKINADVKEKLKSIGSFLKKNELIVYLVILIAIIVISCIVRVSPIPNFKNQVTGEILIPDLDPFLFLRYAEHIVNNGSLYSIDPLKYSPLGYPTTTYSMISYTIAFIHSIVHTFNPEATVAYSAVLYPIIFFAIGLIAFFFLIRKIFKSNLIAIISTFLLSIIPTFLYRTTAGICDKEPFGMAMTFIALLCFAYAWDAKKIYIAVILTLLSVLATVTLGVSWGAVSYLYMILGLFMLLAMIFNKIEKKHVLIYGLWVILSIVLINVYLKGSVVRFSTNLTVAISIFALIAILIDELLFETKIKEFLKLDKIKIPSRVVSLAISLIVGLIFAFLIPQIGGGDFNLIDKIKLGLLHPFGVDRLTLTVVENSQPYFVNWIENLTPLLFWIFIIGAIFLFYETFSEFNKKNKIILNSGFLIVLAGIIFSRYNSSSILNGENFISQFFLFGSMFLFLILVLYVYIKSYLKDKEEFDKFKNINAMYLLLSSWFFWMLLSARGAIRLLFVLSPIIAIIASYSLVHSLNKAVKYNKTKDEIKKIIWWILVIAITIALIYSSINFIRSDFSSTKNLGPSASLQWQRASDWIEKNTQEDSVFSHWWDYGYWLQYLGNRETVLDGGNSIPYWDHLFGRHVLTGQNETEALEFLKTHDTDYLIVDPTDIGKYGAYSSIGSDENYDRLSWIYSFNLDEKQTVEEKESIKYIYVGGSPLDEDFLWNGNLYPKNQAYVIGFIVDMQEVVFSDQMMSINIKQPIAVLHYNNKQEQVPINCVYYYNKKYTFDGGMNACLYIVPRIDQTQFSGKGAALFLSERAMRALWVKLYFFDEGENFKGVHTERDPFIEQIESSNNITIGDIAIILGEVRGPLKIWQISYPDGIEIKPEYLEKYYPDKKIQYAAGFV
ncbi:hypothetical protein AUJ10_02260 [Candidatus Pacearchaeota archaeon CG1_02_31_27]|nr:MAG: hypothetical protein AUJ10_02260 [Candidatus Pacearchaeota archaeon CG1_02_31_27]PIN92526.1 MAG: hypothetical protein COU55_01845 [Candidatus Pacearchaeota archaeon CG10_big_fil_rev_8_21_14_0_10_31_59]PIZ80384.1 MAG: hypothetical protein COX99_02730 [Candidatus Pacearchaeota archaeon CG_4_10_14_0_2_um_filter_31_10]